MVRSNATAQAIDDVLAGTFPASDPPAWTPGVARPGPETASGNTPSETARRREFYVSGASDGTVTGAGAVGSLIGAMGLVMLVPFVILAIGTPAALGVRGVLALAGEALSFIR
jgi:hypothetical protein